MKLSLLSLAAATVFAGGAAAAARPNLLFIMADDCTFRDIGCYGGQEAELAAREHQLGKRSKKPKKAR
jgi:hypothetical protein